MEPEPRASSVEADSDGRLRETLLVIALFWGFSVIWVPAPAPNEPHYLAKGRHYWQPEWCARDFFLASSNAHVVFYATIGWLTQYASFPVTSWIGRLLALGGLGWSWGRLGQTLGVSPGAALCAATCYLVVQSTLHWSGEWLVGGVESKVFAYALLFSAWADWLQGQYERAAFWQGLAIAMHPVVGLWAGLAGCGAEVLCRVIRKSSEPSNSEASGRALTLSRGVMALVVMMLSALPGLIPAVKLILEPVDARTRFAANYLQVFYRLSHHLDPMRFPPTGYWSYAVLILVWLGFWRWGPSTRRVNWIHGLVLCSVIFAACGIAIGYGPRPAEQMSGFAWKMSLLKFYPFRLADVLIPCSVVWCLSVSAARAIPLTRISVALAAGLLATAALVKGQGLTRAIPADPDWLDVCSYAKLHLPADALVQTPHHLATFKWYAERAEYVNFKDCPQDAAGIVEWNRRLKFLSTWFRDQRADGLYSREELQALHRETGITHIVTDRLGPMEIPSVYENATFRVYDLTR